MSIDRAEIERIHSLLASIKDPEIGISIEKLRMIESVDREDGRLQIGIKLTVPGCPLSATIEKDIKETLAAAGYDEAEVSFSFMTKKELEKVKEEIQTEQKQIPYSIERYDKKSIRNIVAVYSAKGGVGKSTVVTLMAIIAKNLGHKVAILDCDISGPSVLSIFGETHRAEVDKDGKIKPFEMEDIKVVSIDMLTDAEAIIWRGPLISSAIKQMYNNADWGKTDLLLLDLPPGTSDAPLTVFQSIPVDRVIVVTTPQSLSKTIGKKTIVMANALNIPVSGIIENMSYIRCKNCGHKIEVPFVGKEGIEGVPILAKLPLETETRQTITDMARSEAFAGLKNVLEEVIS